MRYLMPNYPCEFELPDDWLAAAGIDRFSLGARCYHSTGDAVPVPLHEIEPPFRVSNLP